MRALLLDIGNTRLKWGVYDGTGFRETGDILQSDIRERGLSVLTSRLPPDVDAVWASNVAGAGFGARLNAVIRVHCGCEVHFTAVAKQAFGLRNGYVDSRRLGVDRWVAMIGAWAEEQTACLIVDAGTAVTIDAVDTEGRHLGGQIIPGIALMARALSVATSDIPLVDAGRDSLSAGQQIFGNSTSEAVSLGSVNAIVGAVERAARTMCARDCKPRIVLTGGDASRILRMLDEPIQHRPHLVLSGLAHMLDHHR